MKKLAYIAAAMIAAAGCRSFEPNPIDWEAEALRGATNEVRIASADDAATLALAGNRPIHLKRA